MTLPLIYTLNHCSKKDKRWLINSVKNHNKDKRRVKKVISFDWTGNKQEFHFSRIEINKNFPKDTFELDIPADVEIIK